MQSIPKPSLFPSIQYSEAFTRFEELRAKVLQKRPILQKIIDEHGSKTLYEYAAFLRRQNDVEVDQARKDELIHAIQEETERLLGTDIAKSAAEQLQGSYHISTTEHTMPLSDAGMTQSHILRALPLFSDYSNLKNIITLACANISFDNNRFPRGILFHTEYEGQLFNEQVTFFGRGADSEPVIHHKAYNLEVFKLIRKRVITMVNERRAKKEIGEKINTLLEEIFKHPKLLSCDTYTDQVTIANFEQWKKMFRGYEDIAPNLIFLSQESIALKLILKHHLTQPTLINRFLFDETVHTLMIKYCQGILGSFNIEKNYGTFLFWAIPPGQKYRQQLWKKGRFLETADGSYKIELTPEAIRDAILNKELIPSLLLTFFMLSFYYGIRMMGGLLAQTTYLTQMKNAYLAILNDLSDLENMKVAEKVETTDVAYAYPLIAFLEQNGDKRIAATGTDFYLYATEDTLPKMIEIARSITVEEAFCRALPRLYRSYYKKEGYDDGLLAIDGQYIEKLFGMDKKIGPIATLA